MTTFTLQDLNQNLTNEEFEAMQALAKLGGGIDLGEMFKEMGEVLPNPQHPFKDAFKVEPVSKEEWVQHGMNNPLSASALAYATQQAPAPQHSQIDPIKLIDEMMSQFSIKLKLLATVITQTKAQPETTPPEGNPPNLQETIELLLQQSNWFKDMVADAVDRLDFEDLITESVKTCVECEVEHYFSHSFNPHDHFDIDEVVSDQVDDKIDNAIANYMEGATLTIERN